MTEDEAKTKWCPFVRYSSAFDDYAANRWKQGEPADEPHALNPVPCRCIGSACMAWRWDYAGTVIAFDGMITDAQLDRIKRQTTPQHGFCGLAGKP